LDSIRKYFYRTSAILSGTALVLMALLILAQIAARFFNTMIPSSEDFAGWLLSATIFFGLAYTFNEGGHIRVSILLTRMNDRHRRWLELLNLATGLLVSGYLALYTFLTAYESYDFGDVTDTYLVVPLWVVQTPMALGSLFLFIAMLDSLSVMLGGKTPRYMDNEVDLESEA